MGRTLDRVSVLGDSTHGHTGCVNALSWARDGELLLSGGDDTTVRIWSIDPANTSQEYPYVCRSIVWTGHRANIFSAHLLPHSTRIATVAGDRQVRVFDVNEASIAATDGRETQSYSRQSCTHILRCHEGRVKRIITEDSPDLFLSVGEDGSVRQHDLRTPHDCRSGSCPAPLVKVNHELSTLALSPLTPFQFVVAGESPYGYLFDRRHAGRFLQEEWGVVPRPNENNLTTCVRRFGRLNKATSGRHRSEHITGARMSTRNGHEVLLSYSADAVYLYSTLDDPGVNDSGRSSSSSLIASNAKRRKLDDSSVVNIASQKSTVGMDVDDNQSAPTTATDVGFNSGSDGDDDTSEGYLESDDGEFAADGPGFLSYVPVVLPRQRYVGARNVDTVKDVNFLGPNDDYVASGSDDGHFFIWRKITGELHGIYEGDSSVVNVIEGHPHLPLIAVSGIDTTVKLFAPIDGPSKFSRTRNAESIVEANTRPSGFRRVRYSLALLARARLAMGTNNADIPECTSQ